MLLHMALVFAKLLPAFVVRVVVADLRAEDYDDTVVIPELRQSQEESQDLRLARTLRTDEKKVLIRDVGVDERAVGDITRTC
jgi:hypothetical protein